MLSFTFATVIVVLSRAESPPPSMVTSFRVPLLNRISSVNCESAMVIDVLSRFQLTVFVFFLNKMSENALLHATDEKTAGTFLRSKKVAHNLSCFVFDSTL